MYIYIYIYTYIYIYIIYIYIYIYTYIFTYLYRVKPVTLDLNDCLPIPQGVALQIDSEFAIIKSAYPFIASRLLTDRSPRLQSALMALIFKEGKLRWDRLEV